MSTEQSTSSGFTLDGFHDVEDYIWDTDGDGLLSRNPYDDVFDLVQKANRAFREKRYEEAIESYSRANCMKPLDHIILSNRSATYIRLSQFRRQRSPSASEYRPLTGLDMTTLAELALKDAEKLVNLLNNSVTPYLLKAGALILLERYDVARDAIHSGLQIDPFCNSLRTNLQNLEIATASMTRSSHEIAECTDEFDCTVCLKLLYEPVTTSCGHSFCRSCIFQSVDRGNKCPLCRTVLFITPRTCAVSVTLNSIIQKNFPEEYAERKSEHGSSVHLGDDFLPLFVMDAAIPGQKFPLHIFEPRYRLLVRRAMEGNHRMGMVSTDPTTGLIADFACEVEITECEPLPDGRFVLEIESRRRCHILRYWDQDGYRVAEVEWVRDLPPRDDKETEDLLEITDKAAGYARVWLIAAQREANQDRRKLDKIRNVVSMMPEDARDPELFSFWLATLSDRRPSERLELLRIRDTKERIRRGLIFLTADEPHALRM